MVDLIKTQNNGFSAAYIKILGKFEKADYTYKKYNVIIEVDHDTAIYLDREKKINIGFDRVCVSFYTCENIESFFTLSYNAAPVELLGADGLEPLVRCRWSDADDSTHPRSR